MISDGPARLNLLLARFIGIMFFSHNKSASAGLSATVTISRVEEQQHPNED
jgi:hypothetical protein